MPSRSEIMRARDRLQSATPICDDASLLKLDEEVAECLREAKRDDHSRPDELVSTVVDGVARSYFSYILQKQARVTPVRRRTRLTLRWMKPATFHRVAGAIEDRAVGATALPFDGSHPPPSWLLSH